MSEWLNLVKGVVDSEERLLSITWDTLQRNKILCVIKKKVVKKGLETLKDQDC